MVLGLYYMTKERLSTRKAKILGQDLTFIQLKRHIVERRKELELMLVSTRAKILTKLESWFIKIIQTTAGRII
jgi:DNA-directed RNA polymerase subunit beta'